MTRTSRRTSQILVITLMLIVGTGVFAAMRKIGQSRSGPPSPATINQLGPCEFPPLAASSGQPAVSTPPLLSVQTPPVATQPVAPVAIQPATPKAEMPVVLSGTPLADGRAKFDSGDLLAARRILNDSLIAGAVTGADVAAAKNVLTKIGQQMIFSKRIFKDDPFCTAYTVQTGDRLTTIANQCAVPWELLGRINGISDPRKVRAMQTIKLIKGPFHAIITKSAFSMDLYLGAPGGPGSLYVCSYPVGLGKDDSTPAGTWKVELHEKLRNPVYYSPRGEGVIQAKDPRNPLGLFWIGLNGIEGQAMGQKHYGIHGTIDPNSIGKQESMGCIRLRNEDVAMVFEMLYETKSLVVVKD